MPAGRVCGVSVFDHALDEGGTFAINNTNHRIELPLNAVFIYITLSIIEGRK